jgi:uncharacterized protein
VAARVLIDTNIFLEVLLEQKRWKLCEEVLRKHKGESALTDFALHSIGIVLLGRQESALFNAFLDDVLVRNDLLTLPSNEYARLISIHQKHRLGFDDAYQLAAAEHYTLELLTLDRHFEGLNSSSKVTVLR